MKKISESADGGWIQILRGSDQLIGWSSKHYLAATTPPIPEPPIPEPPTPEPPTPPPTEVWLRVTASALNVREG
ncbi:MAG TPA: hypothetical protein PLM89_01655, partial [Anaerolineales bacterium]|nr:hypothetical protein [Anaerolineales bacterium]